MQTDAGISNAHKPLQWTGERMVPHLSDAATELFHWQRYLYFRPWYAGARVIDAASGEGYGLNYAATFAAKATGFDISREAVDHANACYRTSKFAVSDVCTADYSSADIVTSFETIEHLPDPKAFLAKLSECQGKIVISTPNRKTHSPGNKLSDKPLNSFHTIEWTPLEFASLVQEMFPNRRVDFLSQEGCWPGLIRPGLDDEAMYSIAVIREAVNPSSDFPVWPKIGLSMPTVNNFIQAREAILALSRYYPGELEFAVVANGTEPGVLADWRAFASDFHTIIHLVETSVNRGYGVGSNLGLEVLRTIGGFDLYGVTNDDVYPSIGCMSELANAFIELTNLDQKPGLLGITSNYVAGRQQVDLGGYTTIPEMMQKSDGFLKQNHSGATPWVQVRGLFFVMSEKCLDSVGGFDPIFGLGNFEDDDLSFRVQLAGFKNWIIDGAYLHHFGSQTFQALKLDYSANITRNQEIFMRKWSLKNLDDWLSLPANSNNVPLYVSLNSRFEAEIPFEISGETVDVLAQATELEFATWVYQQVTAQGPGARRRVAEVLRGGSGTAVVSGAATEAAAA